MRLAISFSLALLAAPALAAEGAKPPGDGVVDLSTIALPVVSQGRLVNYVFVTVRLVLKPGADQIKLRDKEPYFRDLLVREGYRRPFVRPGDLTHVDDGRIRALVLAQAPRLAGPGLVAGVQVLNETPQHRAVRAPEPTRSAIVP